MVLGAVALVARKGGTAHRRSGLLFVWVMVVMGTTASILALRNGPTDPNLFAALMTGYFVGTALTTVRPVSRWTRRFDVAALIVVVRSRARLDRGRRPDRSSSPGLSPGGVPLRTIGVMSFILAIVMLLAAAGDARILLARRATRRAAPGAPSVADVLRAVHRGGIVLLDP